LRNALVDYRFPAATNLKLKAFEGRAGFASNAENLMAIPDSHKEMMETSSQLVSRLLQRWSDGDIEALDQLMPLVYDELRRMARRYMKRQPAGHTLQTTALIHEAYLRLVGQEEKRWENRAHFFGVAAQAMRHILVDYARARHRAKRGGEARAVSLEEAAIVSEERAAELVALVDALAELARLSPRQSRVVELRYFGGLSVAETAEALNVSTDTVTRDWNQVKAWLYRALKLNLAARAIANLPLSSASRSARVTK
jgi:RNA polymerase sigma factor (TIGR02999 family)